MCLILKEVKLLYTSLDYLSLTIHSKLSLSLYLWVSSASVPSLHFLSFPCLLCGSVSSAYVSPTPCLHPQTDKTTLFLGVVISVSSCVRLPVSAQPLTKASTLIAHCVVVSEGRKRKFGCIRMSLTFS